MQKIRTLFRRDPETDFRYVTKYIHPECYWVRTDGGIPRRKWNGLCTMLDEHGEWFVRHIMQDRFDVPWNFIEVDKGGHSGSIVGWLPVHSSPYERQLNEALQHGSSGEYFLGTYELCGPSLRRNFENLAQHTLIRHDTSEVLHGVPTNYARLCGWLASKPYEGVVWYHPRGGKLAKIKRDDFKELDTRG